MTKDKFFTVGWNNWLTLVFGLPTLIYIIIFFSTSLLSDFWGFIGIIILGVIYWTTVELHSNMRFAWMRKKSGDTIPAKLRFIHPLNLIYLLYNSIYWIPIILPFTGAIDYITGFILFSIVIIIRGIANIVRNNIIKPEQGRNFSPESLSSNKLFPKYPS